MNVSQVPVHVARRASDRLANDIYPDLPMAVSQVMADDDPGSADAGGRPDAALVARCAVLGWTSFVERTLGAAPPEQLSDADLRDLFEKQLRVATQRPPNLTADQYERVVSVVADELLEASRRHVRP